MHNALFCKIKIMFVNMDDAQWLIHIQASYVLMYVV